MRIFEWMLQRKLVVLIGFGALLAAGVAAWFELPIDAFPDVTNTQVMILSKAPGLAAVDVEQRVSAPIELTMRGLPKVTQVRSLSRAELSQVVVIFEDGVDTYWTRQIVFERLVQASESLPAGVEPELGPISTGLGEIFQYTLESDRHTAMELRTLQDWLVGPLLKPVPGVTEVNSFGGAVKQYQVLIDPDRLLKYGLTVDEVVTAVERNNQNAGGGVIVRGWEQTYLRGVGLLQDIPDIERIVLRAADGAPVFLRDVADVAIGAEPRQGAATRDGKGEVVAGMVIMLKGENAEQVVNRVKQAVAKIGGVLPPGVRLSVFYDRISLIEACIDTVLDALLEGALFVVLVLFLFVAELRTALIVVLSLPFTFLITFVLLRQVGVTANLMSLGGLAFSVGMVVDASIVVVENMRRHRAAALPGDTGAAATRGVTAIVEVARPVAFSVLIIAIILAPLFTLQGVEGKMFEPMAIALGLALLVSLGVAFTAVPVLADLILPTGHERQFKLVRRIHEGYGRWLERSLRHPWRTLGLALVGLAAAIGAVPFVGTEFMPALDEGAIAINTVRLPNAALDGSIAVASYIEKRLLTFPEVDTVVSKTGRAEISEDPMGPEQSDVYIMLKPRQAWTSGRNRAELVHAMQQELGQIPGLRLSFSQPIALRVNELISGVKSDLAVKIFGDDLDALKKHADTAATVLRNIPGASDLKVEQISGMNQYDVTIDRAALARYGLNVSDVNRTIEVALAGVQATTLLEGQQRFAVTVRYAASSRRDIADVERMLIAAPGNVRVPLGQLARLQLVEAPSQISRENGRRRVVVECNVRGRDLGSFVADAQQQLAPLQHALPSGYYIEYGGQFENQQRAMRRLAIVVPIALALIVALLYLALGSLGYSALVLLNLPFALVGGVLALAASGVALSVSAAVAFIVLLGVAVQNGVVLVAFFQQLRERGRSVGETVREGCAVRFRPLLMTALTSFIGHLPMLYARGSGAEIQRPLAIVVMGGLVTSTLLTLFVLPALYAALATRFGSSEER